MSIECITCQDFGAILLHCTDLNCNRWCGILQRGCSKECYHRTTTARFHKAWLSHKVMNQRKFRIRCILLDLFNKNKCFILFRNIYWVRYICAKYLLLGSKRLKAYTSCGYSYFHKKVLKINALCKRIKREKFDDGRKITIPIWVIQLKNSTTAH